MILLRFHFLLLRWHGRFLGCISKMCLHLMQVWYYRQYWWWGFLSAVLQSHLQKEKNPPKKQEQNTRAVEEALEEKAGERTCQFGLHHSSSNLHSYSQRAHFKMLTIQSDFFHFGKPTPPPPHLMFPWREQSKAPLSSYWKWDHSPRCGSLSVSERMTEVKCLQRAKSALT